MLQVATFFIGWLVWSIVLLPRGQTPAKQLLRMRVVMADTGDVASVGTMLLREVVVKAFLDALTCGVIAIVSGFQLFGDRSRTVWDRMAGTVVVNAPRS